ncbi:MAG TPA: UpxY family transcription antiterminator [Candidatus Acidoferrales bacterium]
MGQEEPLGNDERFPVAWYALYSKHQHEKKAADLLGKKGFEVLLPTYRATHRWKDRTQVVVLPVFPCYLFVHCGLDRKLDLLRTPGVFSVVESGGRGCAIPAAEIAAIRRITTGSAHFEPHPFLKSGDRIRIRSGSFEGIEGFLVRAKNHYRVVVNIELLSQAIAVEVDVSVVEKISSTKSKGRISVAASPRKRSERRAGRISGIAARKE